MLLCDSRLFAQVFCWKLTNGHLYNGPKNLRAYAHVSAPAIIAMTLDCAAGTLRFAADGVDKGVAFTGLSGKRLRFFVASSSSACTVQLMSYASDSGQAAAPTPPQPDAQAQLASTMQMKAGLVVRLVDHFVVATKEATVMERLEERSHC